MKHFPCFFARFASTPCDFSDRPDGRPDPCHLIPQARMRTEYRRRRYPQTGIDFALRDRRIIVPGCRFHHRAFDITKTIRLELEDYPEAVMGYAEEYGWYFHSPERGWRPLADDVRGVDSHLVAVEGVDLTDDEREAA